MSYKNSKNILFKYPEWIFTIGNVANIKDYLLLPLPPLSQHRQHGLTLKLIKLHSLTQNIWSNLKTSSLLGFIDTCCKI